MLLSIMIVLIYILIYMMQTFPSLHSLVITYLFIFLIMIMVTVVRGYLHLILVLICIYLIVNNVGLFLHMSFSHLHFSLEEWSVFQIPGTIFRQAIFFCLILSYDIPYVFRALTQCQTHGLYIFPSFHRLPFHGIELFIWHVKMF